MDSDLSSDQNPVVDSPRDPVLICVPPKHILYPMELPCEVRERFRAFGSVGGHRRAARMSATERTAVARRAAATRWIRERFGVSSFEQLGLPGAEEVDTGLTDLAYERATAESLAVSLAAPRLRREGVPVTNVLGDPERRLYELLSRTEAELAHARYSAWLRRLVSFADACRLARVES